MSPRATQRKRWLKMKTVGILLAFIFAMSCGDSASNNQVAMPAPTPVVIIVERTPMPTPIPVATEIPEPAPDRSTIEVDIRLPTNKGWVPFTIPKSGGRIRGRLEGEGGLRGEFNCYIMTDEQLKAFRNGQTAFPDWSNENETVVDIDQTLSGGTYYLVFKHVGIAGRRVTGTLRISKK